MICQAFSTYINHQQKNPPKIVLQWKQFCVGPFFFTLLPQLLSHLVSLFVCVRDGWKDGYIKKLLDCETEGGFSCDQQILKSLNK